jgi:predicted nucleic acid-binding protein
VSFLLDTNICSFHLRNRDSLTTWFIQHSGRIAVPTIVVGELHAWAHCTADLMIASVALVHDLTLVTHNTKDFRHIPGLRLEDWIADL